MSAKLRRAQNPVDIRHAKRISMFLFLVKQADRLIGSKKLVNSKNIRYFIFAAFELMTASYLKR